MPIDTGYARELGAGLEEQAAEAWRGRRGLGTGLVSSPSIPDGLAMRPSRVS